MRSSCRKIGRGIASSTSTCRTRLRCKTMLNTPTICHQFASADSCWVLELPAGDQAADFRQRLRTKNVAAVSFGYQKSKSWAMLHVVLFIGLGRPPCRDAEELNPCTAADKVRVLMKGRSEREVWVSDALSRLLMTAPDTVKVGK